VLLFEVGLYSLRTRYTTTTWQPETGYKTTQLTKHTKIITLGAVDNTMTAYLYL